MIIDSIKYDSINNNYTASVTFAYSKAQSEKLGYSSDKAELQYKKQGKNIILETLIIK